MVMGIANSRTTLKTFLSHIGECRRVLNMYIPYNSQWNTSFSPSLSLTDLLSLVYQGLIRTCSHPVVMDVVRMYCSVASFSGLLPFLCYGSVLGSFLIVIIVAISDLDENQIAVFRTLYCLISVRIELMPILKYLMGL